MEQQQQTVRRRARRATAAALGGALAVSLAVVGQSATAAPANSGDTAGSSATASSMKEAFAKSAEEYGVPRDLLVALAYGETHLDGHHGEPSNDNGYGVMHLVSNPERHSLERAATLTGETAAHLKGRDAANIRGGAAVLRHYADAAGLSAADRKHSGAWYPAVARYGVAAKNGQLRRLYADTVYSFLHKGIATTPKGAGEKLVRVAASRVDPVRGSLAKVAPIGTRSPDYPDAKWVPANGANFKAGRTQKITTVVIHVTEGSYAGSISWFQNPEAQVSAHYVVRSADGEITQTVRDTDTAYHARDANAYALGVEHEGYVDDAKWFTDAMYRSSAALVKHLCDVHGIPKDRQHIVGHSEVPGNDHTDPGPHWNWDTYMGMVKG